MVEHWDRTLLLKFEAWFVESYPESKIRFRCKPGVKRFTLSAVDTADSELSLLIKLSFKAFAGGYRCSKSLTGRHSVTTR